MINITDSEFSVFSEYLAEACGIDVPNQKRYLFVTRLQDLLQERKCSNFSQLFQQIRSARDDELRVRLVEAMTTNETAFFRDRHPFECLCKRILPQLAARRREEATFMSPSLRILSAGCSTGEEPYTVAICVQEWLRSQSVYSAEQIVIQGVDISRPSLAQARRAIYETRRLGYGLRADLRARYFIENQKTVELRQNVRTMVRFSRVNLSERWGNIGRFDVVLFRNVMIYFSRELKLRILDRIYETLLPGGVLMLGASETLYGLSDQLQTEREGQTTFYVKNT